MARKNKSLFKKSLIIYSGIAAILVVVFLVYIFLTLKSYEDEQTTNVIKNTILYINFCVFIIPKNTKYDFSIISFNFAHRFDKESENFYDYYEKEGLSKKDIKELNKLFAEYTFENYYEGLFFASKFFNKKGKRPTLLQVTQKKDTSYRDVSFSRATRIRTLN